jgi:predicted enzyme related to lactoylglutathione lyase
MQETTHPAGSFCWVELGTSDQPAAAEFYGGLFGWTSEDHRLGPDETYTVTSRNGQDVAGIYGLRPAQRARGVPAHWVSYVSVADADAAAARITALGGTVVAGPVDAGDYGRMAIAADTEGAMFAVWQAKGRAGAGACGEDGTVTWTELATRKPDTAKAFYGAFLGWTFADTNEPGMPYTLIEGDGGRHVGGLFVMPAEMSATVPAHWMTYFQVADCDERAQWVAAHGGRVVIEPTDIPGTGRFAVLQDPQGAVFSVMASAPR